MRLLITGGSGQVAYDLARLASYHHTIFSPARDELCITDLNAVREAIRLFSPDIVINTAAYTAVDRAEEEREVALSVNFEGAKNLAIACEEMQCPLIHLSTDYVFNGETKTPYTESDEVNPINFYGESKWKGEEAIRQYCEKSIIVRVSAVFGVQGNNFVKTILRLAKTRDELRVVGDQYTCPTSADSIAEMILTLCINPRWGLFHYCGMSSVNWYDFAEVIIQQASVYETFSLKKLEKILTKEYVTPAKRPLYSVLACEKIQHTFGIQQPDWKKGLNNVIRLLYTA